MNEPVQLGDLAERINFEHEACVGAMRSALIHAIEAGRLLIEAKERVGHGGWLSWVRGHCSFGERMAQRYMKAARWRELNPTRATDLSLREVMAELAAPDPEAERRAELARLEAIIDRSLDQVVAAARVVLDLIRSDGREQAAAALKAEDPEQGAALIAAADALAAGAGRSAVAALVRGITDEAGRSPEPAEAVELGRQSDTGGVVLADEQDRAEAEARWLERANLL